VDRGVVLWIEGWCCGSRGGAVDRGVVLWIEGWCCGSRGGHILTHLKRTLSRARTAVDEADPIIHPPVLREGSI
jgi:hypothetical protein